MTSNRILFAAAIATGTLIASAAYAGSPYYTHQGTMLRDTGAAPGQLQADEYRAAVPDAALGTQPRAATQAVPTVKMGADGYEQPEKSTSLFNHATGSDGSP